MPVGFPEIDFRKRRNNYKPPQLCIFQTYGELNTYSELFIKKYQLFVA